MSARDPLHVQVLQILHQRVEKRRAEHRAKTGDGLEDREYQRHVGRIRESTVLLDEIGQLLKTGLDALEDEDEVNDEQS